MTVSIYQLGHKKLSQVIFEWQAADRASLLALFVVMEVSSHWLWCFYVWIRQDAFGTYVDMQLLYPVWLSVTLVGLFFWWMVGYLSRIKNDNKRLLKSQILLILVYSFYISFVIVIMGHSSLVSGVSLVGGAMLGMMLLRRRYIWNAFVGQVVLILLVAAVPYLGVSLPNLRQLTMTSIPADAYGYLTYSEMMSLENAIATSIFQNGVLSWDSIDEMRKSSAFFWRTTHIYLALPKAIFMIYVFRTLLFMLDKSKAEILQHANQDGLTQLTNRRYGLNQMQQILMATADAQDHSVILLDLDLFKSINDNHGHEVGDQVLREIAEILTKSLANAAIISRYGGEEFLIMLPNTAHTNAMKIAERLRRAIAQHIIQVNDNLSFKVTASLGLYTLSFAELMIIKQEYVSEELQAGSQNIAKLQKIKQRANAPLMSVSSAQLPSNICQRLISIADKALYKAKDRGRNQVVSANELIAADLVKINAQMSVVEDAEVIEPRYGT